MKIALLGYGRMGQEIEKVASQYGHEVAAIFDIDNPLTTSSHLNGAQIFIDFTLKDAVLENLKIAAALGIPIVEGTTGWNADITELKQIANLTLIFSPNFSIGVYQFTKLVAYAAQLFGPLAAYDCYLHEWHHTGKADSPSGTAKKLANILVDHLPQKTGLLTETSHKKIDVNQLHVTSTRVGRIPGTHEIGFDSDFDFIQLKHTAHGRVVFADGAIRAAEWLINRQGIFTMDDFMASYLKS
jgi:4-hydroxy-tetrahydrodipicolinate reductase